MSGLNFSSILPPDAQWIAPWVEGIMNQSTAEVSAGRSPYPPVIRLVEAIYYPSTAPGFQAQLWFLCGLFATSILILIASLALRLRQGRFWLFHNVGIIIPNVSTLYGLCALVYAGLGIWSIVTGVRISNGEPFPRYWVGLQAAWIAPLWLGFAFEAWATLSAWYIRKKGAFYRESRFKTAIAIGLPILLPLVAWVPPIVIFSNAALLFNRAFRVMQDILTTLTRVNSEWTPAKGYDLTNVIPFFGSGIKLANGMRDYSRWVRAGYIYIAVVLLITFVVYTTGALLEINHLNHTIKKLHQRARSTPRPGASPRPLSAVGTPVLDEKVAAQLDDEFFAGVKRQATLLTWARNNRLYSAVAIGLMLVVNAGLTLWLGFTPLSIETDSAQFQVEILVACWLNGTLSTVVALLILFRSLDGGSATVQTLRRYLPFLPFPPPISITDPSRATTREAKASRLDEPPKYPGSPGWAASAHSPVMEERKTPGGLASQGGDRFLAVPVMHEHGYRAGGAVSPGLSDPGPEGDYFVAAGVQQYGDDAEAQQYGGEYDLDAALDTAWYGFGVVHGQSGGAAQHGLAVTLEMDQYPVASTSRTPSPAGHVESEEAERGDEVEEEGEHGGAARMDRLDSWDQRGAARPDSWDGAK
ncbi:hypothetical protein Rhopal_002729-T1 [Rhodotorula paludigena]|uniref:Proteophosphoglycan ppg4 n=1 Tax=Rhodotorula paludigena TaxID=86838 RepID=A0AAV5GIS1_9BASI|nr:hypothetical protein Rhopal_002729-T1 [Rhodotorula paludigena]